MSNDENEDKNQISLSKSELNLLKEKYDLDLSDLNSLKKVQESSVEIIRRIREIERKALRKMHPDTKHVVPEGEECSFCYKAENEVKVMVKHESGFNICNECVQSIQKAEEE